MMSRVLLWMLAALACAAVFAAYLAPDMLLTLATQLWTCF